MTTLVYRHRQTGYQSGTLSDGRRVALLHGTCVLEYKAHDYYFEIRFNCNGWHTRATTKAMNGALQDFGLSRHFTALIRKGQINIVNHKDDIMHPIENDIYFYIDL